MRVSQFELSHAQLGWNCVCVFRHTTALQFSDTVSSVRAGSRWMLLALIKSWWCARKHARGLRPKPGEREAKGWV